jgi:hypothetical protein
MLRTDLISVALKFLWLHICWGKTWFLWPWSFCDYTHTRMLRKDLISVGLK